MGSPLSAYEQRFKGNTGENGAKGATGANGVNGPANVLIKNKTADYTLVLEDANVAKINMDLSVANTVTVPPDSEVDFPDGAQILLMQKGTGQTTVTAGAGVTILSADGKLNLNVQYSGATLIKEEENVWSLFGDIV